jgi:hypothetical protein
VIPPTRPATAPISRRPGRLPPHKVILGLILIGSILFFFLILFVSIVAILREAAPTGHAGLTPLVLALKRGIAHHK